ncbi:MAG: alginate lyase family protein [Actinomycetota bacterium]
MTPKWYLKRLASMSPAEIVGRVEDEGKRRLWRHRPTAAPRTVATPRLPVTPHGLLEGADPAAMAALTAAAEGLLKGRWSIFGMPRTDQTADLDYFVDHLTGTRAPDTGFSLAINHRDEAAVGNVKFVWEPARHQHLTVLAAAYAATGDVRYAERVDVELRNYWAANPFLVGIHWTSGIELGLRLISWTWVRRLLDGWPGAADLFEHNPVFVEQLGRHQQWLAGFASHGSSANNHLIAEACGQFVAASAFGLFEPSDRWRAVAAEDLARELPNQTFNDGLNRELASDYHGFVLEMCLAAFLEAVLTGHPLADQLAEPLARNVDALQAVVDDVGHPHRQGDSDDAHGWLVDPVDYNKWGSLLNTGPLLATPARWWHRGPEPDIRTAVVAAVTTGRQPWSLDPDRPRPSRFSGAGLTILRDHAEGSGGRTDPELWIMFDHGPHGYLSTAAHAHADALATEIRYGGIEVVADPGTYCYHGEPEWRDHFRSTVAHATVTVAERNQSEIGGPFLWTRKAETILEGSRGLEDGLAASCVASHNGYSDLGVRHRRSVELDREARTITIVDTLVEAGEPAADAAVRRDSSGDGTTDADGGNLPMSKSFPLGPTVQVDLDNEAGTARLSWPENSNRVTVTLDPNLSWSVVDGRVSPPLGWYSGRFGTKQPSAVLLGETPAAAVGEEYRTLFTFESQSAK